MNVINKFMNIVNLLMNIIAFTEMTSARCAATLTTPIKVCAHA